MNAQQFRTSLAQRTALVNQALDATSGGSLDDKVAAVMTALDKGGLFLIVQDIYPTETAQYAHLVLPAAQWGEKNLTSINGERRLRLYQQFMDAPGIAEPDWKIMARMAQRLEFAYRADGKADIAARFSGFTWTSEEEVFRAAAAGTRRRGLRHQRHAGDAFAKLDEVPRRLVVLGGGLDQTAMSAAIATIRAWRADPAGAPGDCPVCGAKGLVITDCSARPHAEWYRLQCAACGLEEMLNIPLGTSGSGGMQ